MGSRYIRERVAVNTQWKAHFCMADFGILKVTGPAQSVGASLWGQSSSLMTQPSVKGGGGVKGSSSAK